MQEKPSVFISHIHEDEHVALAVERFVRNSLIGAVNVFNASNRRSIAPGDPWRDMIVEHLRHCKTTLVLASPESVTRPWINFESGGAWVFGNRVVPCCIGVSPSELPAPFVHLQAVSLTSQSGLKDLIVHLAAQCGLDEPKHVDYKQAAEEFRELVRAHERGNLANLFTKETGYNAADALVLFKSAMKEHHISKWGVAVPVAAEGYDLLFGFHFSERYLGAVPFFLPAYAVDAQTQINVRILRPLSDPLEVVTELVWNESTEALLRYLREELLDLGLRPKGVFDADAICERFRTTVSLRAEARSSGGDIRSDIGAVICLVGTEIVLTTNGIEHLSLPQAEPIPYWATFKEAGLRIRAKKEGKTLDDQHWFEKNGFATHPDIGNALTVIRILYSTRFLSGLVDMGLLPRS